MNRLFVIVLITAFASIAKSQTTVTFQPDAVSGKGAVVDYFSSFVNDGNNPECIGENINCETRKSLIQFNLTSTPTNATLLSAALSLSAYNHLE